ncbi:hypothetical protein GALMADRAFT_63042 [Galerina marginata CBS 339.88]|uniref:Transposase family Tnp2 protein n=1 Tax=Galerina marginata (strain CBS 339.88) TaxID=685588 RepID=A0A067TIC0_GALM3|nr:hypothetical protein GALMADRAFT_63042 [Galerina marginata CBS 339.88]
MTRDQQADQDAPAPSPPLEGGFPDDDGVPEQPINFIPAIEDIRTAREFIDALKNASLDHEFSQLDEDTLLHIRDPPTIPLSIDNPTERLSLDLFLAVDNASQDTYNAARNAIKRRFPDEDILSYYKAKRLVEKLTGITAIVQDMCINSCFGFTGPYSDKETCPVCGEPRYEDGDRKLPRKQFHTIPLAPQLQALWRSSESATRLKYRQEYTAKILQELNANSGTRTSPYRDFFDGMDYLQLHLDGKIASGDMILLLSMDGAQLYRNKASECWMYIWIILDHSPDVRYRKRHVLPGGFIPGPDKPKNLDSFMFPGLYHLSALQREGLRIWDASINEVFTSHPFLALATADGPGMACLNGFVGHQGKVHCRLHCPIKGRHKRGAPQYYPARLKPNEYTVEGCDHDDVDLTDLLTNFTSEESSTRYQTDLLHVEQSRNPTEFKRRRLVTGICKPSILSGIPEGHILTLPGCFPLDIMHLPALNIPDLFIPLWRGNFECDRTDNKASWAWAVLRDNDLWKTHGKMVADATPYLPGSFDRPPRNPAEKISSGYKAWEFLLYFYGLGPCLFFQLLPDVYWEHYCKLVRGIQILMQQEIHPRELAEAHTKLTEFSTDFEELYVQRRADRIHFVRPSIHTPSHLAPETERIGPAIIYSQWAIERTIGNLGEEIKQHSNPFSNLALRGLRRCQVNALKAMVPDIEPLEETFPLGSKDLGQSYALLRAMDNTARPIDPLETTALDKYFESQNIDIDTTNVIRWARLRLPNRQVVRSRWKEELKREGKFRCSRNIKVRLLISLLHNHTHRLIAEVHYFALFQVEDTQHAVAVVSLYGRPHDQLLSRSSKTYYSVQHLRDAAIRVIPVKTITAVVAMIPDQQYGKFVQDGTHEDRWQLVEKPGLHLLDRVLHAEDRTDEENDV